MKPQNYFRIALFTPYILWAVCLLIFLPISRLEISDAWNAALMPLTFYLFGIILWFIPYTLLAIGLWFWSKDKSITTLRNAALLSPILFSLLLLVEAVVVSLPADNMTGFVEDAVSYTAMLGAFGLVFGYACVGIALGIFKFLQTNKRIAEEAPLVPAEN
jgi:hypothetical protein